jgi:hypothetical protein
MGKMSNVLEWLSGTPRVKYTPDEPVLVENWETRTRDTKPRWTKKKWSPQMRALVAEAPEKADGKLAFPVDETAQVSSATLLVEYFLWQLDPSTPVGALVILFVASTFFAVAKGVGKARAILNAKEANTWFRRAPHINTAEASRAIKTVAKRLGPKLAATADRKRKKLWVVSVDWRHFYHQLRICRFLSNFFSIAWRDPATMRERFFTYRTTPMGWLAAPFASQCLGWHFITHGSREGNTVFDDDVHDQYDAPPQFLPTEQERRGVPVHR